MSDKNDLFEQLVNANSDADRESILLEISLNALSPTLRTAVTAVAIPHWFSFPILTTLIGSEESDEVYDQLLSLSFVEQFPGRGWTIHEETRKQLVNQLWQNEPDRFLELSQRMADYCLTLIQSPDPDQEAGDGLESRNHWRNEEIYHQFVVDPKAGIVKFEEMATAWANYEERSYADIERVIRLANEQIDGGRLIGPLIDRVQLWQARLMLIYGRTTEAQDLLQTINIDRAQDASSAAELADLCGDVAAVQQDATAMSAAWEQAARLYEKANRPFDHYLTGEKMRGHGLTAPSMVHSDDEPEQKGKQLPNRLTQKLLENIEDGWINGVLRQVINSDNRSFSLGMAQGDSGLASSRLRIRRAGGIDQLVTGTGLSGLSGLFQASGRSLLILGAPGSGKTITLLQLLDELIQQAKIDGDAPVPLLFNLSSFGRFEGSFIEWLAEQGYNQYRLGRKTTREQLTQGRRFVLLLDGLDEVPNDGGERDKCVSAINTFMNGPLGVNGRNGLVVCSRISDYKALEASLDVAHAVVLQPLSNRQIEAGLETESQRRLVGNHWQLKEALRSPLLLSLFPQAFPPSQTKTPARAAINKTKDWQRQILGRYANKMLRKNETVYRADLATTVGALTFLAHQMQQASTTVFNIEELQSDWLPYVFLKHRYQGWAGLFVGLFAGLFAGLSNGLLTGLLAGLIAGQGDWLVAEPSDWLSEGLFTGLGEGLFAGLSDWLVAGMIGGIVGGGGGWLSSYFQLRRLRAISGVLIAGLIAVLLGGLNGGQISRLGLFVSLGFLYATHQIEIKDKIKLKKPTLAHWSLHVRRFGGWGLIGGAIGGVIGGLLFGNILVAPDELGFILLFGLIGGFIGGLIGGISGGTIGTILSIFDTLLIDERSTPAQGVHSSIQNSLLMTIVLAFTFGLIAVIAFTFGSIDWRATWTVTLSGLFFFFGFAWTLPIVFTLYGGMAWCQHWALRFVLYWHRFLPFQLVPWLNRMVSAGLLRRVGGGYIFIHRSLREFFADQDQS